MKLKYYLRGLGIGIILTTLIITIGGGRNKLSDSEIITRAMELGMVMKEDPKGNLDEVMETPEDTAENEPKQQEDTKDTENTPSIDQEQDQVDTEDKEQTPETEPTKAPSAEPTEAPAIPTPSPVPAENTEDPDNTVPSEDGNVQIIDKITFMVEKGMSSGKVAAMLQSIGLIESAEEFNNFIIQEGKAGAIMIGKYTVNRNASFEEILNTITK